ncbi:MAG: hypothetical protein HN909_06135, partial [Phycisphaerales bacterium]|nr:hypothetical protein [Phycisphaerales bacterium]
GTYFRGHVTTVWQVDPPPPANPTGQGWDLDALNLPNNDLSQILFSVGNNNNTYQIDDIIQWMPNPDPNLEYTVYQTDLRGTIGGPGQLDALLSPNGPLIVGGGNWPGAGGMFDNTNLYMWNGTGWTEVVDLVSSFAAGPSGIISVHGVFPTTRDIPPDDPPPSVPEPLTVLSLLLCASGAVLYTLRQRDGDMTSESH